MRDNNIIKDLPFSSNRYAPRKFAQKRGCWWWRRANHGHIFARLVIKDATRHHSPAVGWNVNRKRSTWSTTLIGFKLFSRVKTTEQKSGLSFVCTEGRKIFWRIPADVSLFFSFSLTLYFSFPHHTLLKGSLGSNNKPWWSIFGT